MEERKKSFANIKELIFDKDPDAKILIYCGALHAIQKKGFYKELFDFRSNDGLKNELESIPLGYLLEEYTNVKTLIVDLSSLDKYSDCFDLDLTGKL